LPRGLAVPWYALRSAAFYSNAVAMLVLAPVLYMFEVYGRVVDSQSLETLFWLFVALVGLLVLMELLDWLRTQQLRLAAVQFDQQVAPKLRSALEQAQRLDTRATGQAVFQDLKTLREAFTHPVAVALLETPSALVFLALLFWISPWLALAAAMGAVLQLLAGLLHHKLSQAPLAQAQSVAVQADRLAAGFTAVAQTSLALGAAPRLANLWQQTLSAGQPAWKQSADQSAAFQAFSKTIALLVASGLLGAAAYIFLQGDLWGGAAAMILASTLGGRVLAPLAILVAQGRVLFIARQAWNRIAQLLSRFPAVPSSMPLPAPHGHLQLQQASVSAAFNGPVLLRGLQFSVVPGELLVVMGPSGSGKTSLGKALLGLLPVTAGSIRLDGVDVFSWNKDELGPFLGYLPQTVDLFEASLFDNICRFSDQQSAQVGLAKAVDEWGLESLLRRHPHGLNTVLGQDGRGLSGGERQKLGLARAYWGNPALVVLDEPDSALDNAGLQILKRQVQAKKAQGITQVLITHRVHWLALADKVLLLDEGKQRTFGRPEPMSTTAAANPLQTPDPRAEK
jgi:ATP-binding cassette subfamily C exporter for protease/lipase